MCEGGGGGAEQGCWCACLSLFTGGLFRLDHKFRI